MYIIFGTPLGFSESWRKARVTTRLHRSAWLCFRSWIWPVGCWQRVWQSWSYTGCTGRTWQSSWDPIRQLYTTPPRGQPGASALLGWYSHVPLDMEVGFSKVFEYVLLYSVISIPVTALLVKEYVRCPNWWPPRNQNICWQSDSSECTASRPPVRYLV